MYYYFVRAIDPEGNVVEYHQFRSIVELNEWLLNAKFNGVTYKVSRARA